MIAMQSTPSSLGIGGNVDARTPSCAIFEAVHEKESADAADMDGVARQRRDLGSVDGRGAAQPVPVNRTPDATLHFTPETVVWGYFAADIPPVLRIKSGRPSRSTPFHGGR